MMKPQGKRRRRRMEEEAEECLRPRLAVPAASSKMRTGRRRMMIP